MKVHNLQEYIDALEILKRNYTYKTGFEFLGHQKCSPSFIFRGHSKHASYYLLPGILRYKPTNYGETSEYSQLEFNVLEDFISEAYRYIKNVDRNDISAWLEIAQHFGVPTRLLDFTENPFVALYFACCEHKEDDASVWILNETEYKKKFFSQYRYYLSSVSKSIIDGIIVNEVLYQYQQSVQETNRCQYPWIYKPTYREERMTYQSSVFMIWGKNQSPLTTFMKNNDYMSFDDSVANQQQGIICNVLIPGKYKASIIAQLIEYGVNEKFIYPGLDGVGKYIRKKYSGN